MIRLGVNIDHIATIRQARGGSEPDPVTAATLAELGGANGITIHLREDRRHIQERDLELLRKTVQTKLNLEMAGTQEMVNIALKYMPDDVCLVPENRRELTTEGGLDVIANLGKVKDICLRVKEAGITPSIFIEPSKDQIDAAKEAGTVSIELHTGNYANARGREKIARELHKIVEAAQYANSIGLRVNAGHGLNYNNVQKIASISVIEELNIGHSIVSRAVMSGMVSAVKEMFQLMLQARMVEY